MQEFGETERDFLQSIESDLDRLLEKGYVYASQEQDAMDIELHPQAKDQFREYVDNFSVTLLLQAKLIAFKGEANVVVSTMSDDAQQSVLYNRRKSKIQELWIASGGALFGAFIQGFINELSIAPLRPLWIAIYVIAGFVGAFLIF